ncbi:MAG: alkaline phosphatase family protein [Candidatus Omnitrophica bacterium]|nr:alkaline phosphatase family protein [Candidatus Omnitrophota bacterium]
MMCQKKSLPKKLTLWLKILNLLKLLSNFSKMKEFTKKESKKVFLLGLDGATFNVIYPLIKEGKLPNLAKIIKDGVYAYLDSTIPPLTPVAWPGMFTGKLPGKTGIFDFSLPTGKIDRKRPKPEVKRVNSSFIKTKSIWELLTERNMRSVVLDVPLTYPAYQINGVMISRVMAADSKRTVYPQSLYKELKKQGLILDDLTEKKEKTEDTHLSERKHCLKKEVTAAQKRQIKKERVNQMISGIDEKVKLVKYLNQTQEWDFFMAVFMEADQAGHGFWPDKQKISKIYQRLDKAVGEIFSFLPKDCLKVIASDHGFQSVKGVFFVDEWLRGKGYLEKTFEADDETEEKLKNIAQFKEDFHKKPGKTMGRFRYQPAVDYKRSKAYLSSGTAYGIRINLKGRDPCGIVEPRDYESFREELIFELKKIKVPGTNKKLFSHVLKKEDVIGQSRPDISKDSSDIYFLPENMDYCLFSFDKKNVVYKKSKKGFHRKEGIFFGVGPEFKRGFDAGKISILDVTPNVLHLMGMAIPKDCDGRVQKELFSREAKSFKRKPSFCSSSNKKAKEKRLTSKEEEKIKNRLEALGYIE